MTALPKLTLRSLDVRAVNAPLARAVRTASGNIETAPLVLLDLVTDEGVTGTSYVFCYTPVALRAGGDAGREPRAARQGRSRSRRSTSPRSSSSASGCSARRAWSALRRPRSTWRRGTRSRGPRDCRWSNCWAAARDRCGPTTATAWSRCARSRSSPAQPSAAGFRAMKIKVGYADVRDDVKAIREVRSAAGDAMTLMVDYNQSLTLAEALRRTRVVDEEGLDWIEEPLRADDDAGHAQLALAMRTPLQLGENWWGPHDMTRSIAARACRLAMPDVMKIGGVTGWMRAAALAQSAGLPVSSHIFPEISAHLLAVTPTADWLEYLDLARPLLKEPVRVVDGFVTASSRPGSGLEWDEAAVKRHAAH